MTPNQTILETALESTKSDGDDCTRTRELTADDLSGALHCWLALFRVSPAPGHAHKFHIPSKAAAAERANCRRTMMR